jgi:hypothetical protein
MPAAIIRDIPIKTAPVKIVLREEFFVSGDALDFGV